MLYQNPFRNRKVGRPISSDVITIEIINENEWLMPNFRGKFAFFYVTKANFWFLFGLTYIQLQADKPQVPQHAWSHYTLPVFWDLCWYHTVSAQATHAKHMRRANMSLLEQQWRDICEANATRIRRSPLNIEQTNNFACRVWCKPAFSHDRFWVYCRLGRVTAKYLV